VTQFPGAEASGYFHMPLQGTLDAAGVRTVARRFIPMCNSMSEMKIPRSAGLGKPAVPPRHSILLVYSRTGITQGPDLVVALSS
jgi:hypothetical protein